MFTLSQQDENSPILHPSNNPFSTGKKTLKVALSDITNQTQFSTNEILSPPKRYHTIDTVNETSGDDSKLKKSLSANSHILADLENSNSQPPVHKKLLSTKSSGSLLFNVGRRQSSKRKSTSVEKPVEKAESLAVDNNIKTSISFYFDNNISYSLINMILMATRRSQVGHFCMSYPPAVTTRGNMSAKMLCQFVDGVLDSYQTYISKPYNMLKDEHFFYLKGYNFMAMFTHEKSGKCTCLASVCSDLLHLMKQEDVRYIRMRDEDEDDLAEDDLFLYRSNSRLLPSTNSFSQPDFQNTSVILQDPLSIHKFVNTIINYSIHYQFCYHLFCLKLSLVPEAKEMTQILSSFPFVNGRWDIAMPIFKRNVMVGKNRMSSLYFSGLLTKTQVSKLCDVISGAFKAKHLPCSYEIALFSEPLSQSFNTKNSLSTIESNVLQRVLCEITEDNRVYYTHTTKPVIA